MTFSLETATIATPIGMIEIDACAGWLTALRIDPSGSVREPRLHSAILNEATAQIADWFANKRTGFDLPLKPLASIRGNALRDAIIGVGYGETMSYGALAHRASSAPRAIGQACRRNPFPIIVPCHRVTSSSGPEYYSGGAGPSTKAWLIAFEQGKAFTNDQDRLV